jgi:hypothetical protein
MVALADLAEYWENVPGLLTMGILDVFFHHLDESKVPTDPDQFFNKSQDVDRASMALLGFSKPSPREIGEYSKDMVRAWPRIFTWSAFFFAARVQAPSASVEMKRSAMALISSCWLAISYADGACQAIASTVGSVEIAAKLWVLEDRSDISNITAMLNSVLQVGDVSHVDRVVEACGGKPELVASLAVSRLRSAMNERREVGLKEFVLIEFITRISYHPHPLRMALLESNVVHVLTKTLAVLVAQLNVTGELTLVTTIALGFDILVQFLDIDGAAPILQSLHSGLLTVLVECSPHFEKFEHLEVILQFINSVLPRFLLYRSVIEAVDSAMMKIQASPHMHAMSNGVARDDWNKFRKLSTQRLIVTLEGNSFRDNNVICDSIKVNFFILTRLGRR